MRVLLDEQIDWRLKQLFDSGHRVETVRELGWQAKRRVAASGCAGVRCAADDGSWDRVPAESSHFCHCHNP